MADWILEAVATAGSDQAWKGDEGSGAVGDEGSKERHPAARQLPVLLWYGVEAV